MAENRKSDEEALLSPVKNVTNKPTETGSSDDLLKYLISMQEALKAQGKTAESVAAELKKEADEQHQSFQDLLSELNDIRTSQQKHQKTSDKVKNKDSKNDNKLLGVVEKLLKTMSSKGVRNTVGGGGQKGVGSTGMLGVGKITPNITNGAESGAVFGSDFSGAVSKAVEATIGATMAGLWGGTSAYKVLTKGMIADEYEFATGMNLIAYQTEAITGEAYNMQSAFRKTNDIVRDTGFGVTLFQNQLMKTTRRGIKDANSVVKTGLGLGKMMGLSEQESTGIADTFADWNQNLGLSANQLADVSRGIQEASRYSGITGENLVDVVKSSEQFMNRMRSAGTLTSTAAKNIISLQAEAKKLGVTDIMSELNKGLSNSADLLLNSSDQTKTLLIQAAHAVGRSSELIDGTLAQTKGGLRDLSKGYEKLFKRISGGVGFEDIDKLDPRRKAQLNIQIQGALNIGLDDFKRVFEGTAAAGKTFATRMQEIDKELATTVDSEEKLALARKKQELLTSTALGMSSSFAEAAKEATTFDEAIGNMQRKMGPKAWAETTMELADVAGTFSKELKEKVLKGDTKAIAQAMTTSASQALKAAGGRDFTAQIKKAIFNKDFKQLGKLQEQMNVEQQRMGLKTVNALDPMDEAVLQLKAMNETLRSFTGPSVMFAASTAGSVGIMAALMGGMAAHAYFGGEAIKSWIEVIQEMFGVGKVAETASEVIIPNVDDLILGIGGQSVGKVAGTGATTAATAAATAGTSAATTAAGTAGTVATGAAGAATIALSTVLIGLYVLTGVIGAITGNIWAGEQATEYFNTSMEDLTLSQYYAAKGAGNLTGMLNFLTFGIFNKWLGTTGAITKNLALLNEKIPILSAVAATFDVIVGIVWGFMLAIKNIVMGIGEAIYMVIEPFGELFSAFGEIIYSLFSPFTTFTGTLAETGSLFKLVSDAIGSIGMAIRWLLRGIGTVLGFLVKTVLKPIIALVKIIADSVRKALSIVGDSFKYFSGAVVSLFKLIESLFNFDFNKIWENFKNYFTNALKYLVISSINSIFGLQLIFTKFISGLFTGICNYIGSIFDEIEGPLGSFLQLNVYAFKILANLAQAISDTAGGVYDLLIGIASFDGDLIQKAINKIFYSIPTMLEKTFSELGKLMWKVIVSLPSLIISAFNMVLVTIPTLILRALEAVFITFPIWLYGLFIEGLKAVFITLPKMIMESIMGALTDLSKHEIFGPIFQPLLEIMTILYEACQTLWAGLEHLFDNFMIMLEPIKELGKVIYYAMGAVWEIIDLLSYTFAAIFGETKWSVDFIAILKTTAQIIGALIKGALFPLKVAIMASAGGIELLGGLFWALGETFKFIGKIVKNLVDGIIAPFKWLYETLVGHSIVPDLINEIILWFMKLPLQIFKSLTQLPAVIGSSIVNAFSGISNYVYNGLTSAFGNFFQWIKEQIPGYKTAKNVANAAGSAASTVGSVAGGVASNLWEKTKYVASWQNPFAYFEEGTKKIEKTGIGVLHAGEAVIPSQELEQMQAKGSGPFSLGMTGPAGLGMEALGIKNPFGFMKDILQSDLYKQSKNTFQQTRDLVANPIKQGINDVSNMASVASDFLFGTSDPTQSVIPGSDTSVQTSSVQPVPLMDIHGAVKRDAAQTKGDTPKSHMVEMSEIISLNTAQLTYLTLLHGDLREVVDLLTPTRSSNSGVTSQGPLNSKTKSKPIGSPNYHHWQFGRYDQNASQQVITDGR